MRSQNDRRTRIVYGESDGVLLVFPQPTINPRKDEDRDDKTKQYDERVHYFSGIVRV